MQSLLRAVFVESSGLDKEWLRCRVVLANLVTIDNIYPASGF